MPLSLPVGCSFQSRCVSRKCGNDRWSGRELHAISPGRSSFPLASELCCYISHKPAVVAWWKCFSLLNRDPTSTIATPVYPARGGFAPDPVSRVAQSSDGSRPFRFIIAPTNYPGCWHSTLPLTAARMTSYLSHPSIIFPDGIVNMSKCRRVIRAGWRGASQAGGSR